MPNYKKKDKISGSIHFKISENKKNEWLKYAEEQKFKTLNKMIIACVDRAIYMKDQVVDTTETALKAQKIEVESSIARIDDLLEEKLAKFKLETPKTIPNSDMIERFILASLPNTQERLVDIIGISEFDLTLKLDDLKQEDKIEYDNEKDIWRKK